MDAIRVCTARFTSQAPYSSSRKHEEPALPKERPDAYDERTWMAKARVAGPKGQEQLMVDQMAFKFAIDRAAQMLGRRVPGRGTSTYSKFFISGVLIKDPVPIAPVSTVTMDRLFLHASGTRGSGKRVWRHFPRVDNWGGEVTFNIFASELTREVFEETVQYAGQAVGIGRFRPENGGYYGRFIVDSFDWANG